eukprot:CAMPEP_0171087940 /NCGR_PEP_ID=MMETSP0766_2-20121228/20462_1 /TAXON_ID=439317 /ORGANISM="Gambierdiscus australes, Strain CAWD 149" /LENGTH=260 /DNA_ID=CAMNT_0011545679 /DNA_START=9 /DNA_END=791 /DNA_ORIENTATION=-
MWGPGQCSNTPWVGGGLEDHGNESGSTEGQGVLRKRAEEALEAVAAAAAGCVGVTAWFEEDQDTGAEMESVLERGPTGTYHPLPTMLGDITNVMAGAASRPPSKLNQVSPSKLHLQSQQRERTPQCTFARDSGSSPSPARLQAKLLLGSPAAARRQQKEFGGNENAASQQSIFEKAAHAVLDANLCTGMDSQWTSGLAARLSVLGGGNSDLEHVLKLHGWNGVQFEGPPNRQLLLRDLNKASQMSTRPVQARAKPRQGGA